MLVEFACVAPVLFLVIFFFVEFDRYLVTVHAVEEASRVGCRLAILEQSTSQEVQNSVTQILNQFGIAKYTMSITPTLPTTVEGGSPVSVKIDVAYKDVSWLPTPRFLSKKTISATSTMPKEK
ncbi:MAG TPA: pilus assembly protein [Planctomycetaceae bacterium]|nr:pilus assembly protein [Planctomycetaceae bacterium]